MKINKIILISIAIIILSALSVSAAQITYQDTIVYSEQASNGSIMIDADDAAKIFGSDLEIENDSAFFIKDALYAQFTADYDRMLTGACHDGKNDGYREFYREFLLPASPFISDGRFFVPLERLCEFFHYNMESDGENITISQPLKAITCIFIQAGLTADICTKLTNTVRTGKYCPMTTVFLTTEIQTASYIMTATYIIP